MDQRPSATSEERRSEQELIPPGQEQTQPKSSDAYIWRRVLNPSFWALWGSLDYSRSTFRCVGVDVDSFGRGSLCRGHVSHYSACEVSPRSHGFGPRQIAPNLTPLISLSRPLTPIAPGYLVLMPIGSVAGDLPAVAREAGRILLGRQM
jgi:hypothetical protein